MIKIVLSSTLEDLKRDMDYCKRDRDYYLDKYEEYQSYCAKLNDENIRIVNNFSKSVKKSNLYKELKQENIQLQDKIELLESRLKSLKDYGEKL